MKLIELENLVEEIYKYFKDQKVPGKDVLDLWLDQLEHIPLSSLDWILNHIKTTKNSLPTNLPRVINDSFKAYMNQPEKFTVAEEFPDYDCPDCHGGGVLHFRALDLSEKKNKLKYTYVAICNSCRASWKKFGEIQHHGGKISRKSEAGQWIADGPYIPPMMKITKQEILDKGWEFLEAENRYGEKLDEIPPELSYIKLKQYQMLIRKTHNEDLARQAEGLIDEGFTKHEALQAVNQAIELRAKAARDADNPGDIIKQIFNI